MSTEFRAGVNEPGRAVDHCQMVNCKGDGGPVPVNRINWLYVCELCQAKMMEADKIPAEYGDASFLSAVRAMKVLLHGKDDGWMVMSVSDELHKTVSEMYPTMEIDGRRRTITIELDQIR